MCWLANNYTEISTPRQDRMVLNIASQFILKIFTSFELYGKINTATTKAARHTSPQKKLHFGTAKQRHLETKYYNNIIAKKTSDINICLFINII